MELRMYSGGISNTDTSGGRQTDLNRGDGWPSEIPTAREMVDRCFNFQFRITLGFLHEHPVGVITSDRASPTHPSRRPRVIAANEDDVVGLQVSSTLLIPRAGLQSIAGSLERDIITESTVDFFPTELQHDSFGVVNVVTRYNQVQSSIARLGILLSEVLHNGLRDSIEDFLHVWGNPVNVQTGELRTRLSTLKGQLASTYDDYTVDDDIVQFLTGEQSPVNTLPPNQEGTTIPTPLPQVAPEIPANVPAWLESETHSSSSTSNSSNSSGSRRIRPGRLYLRVVFSIDDGGNPIHIYPMFKHGTFRINNENLRSRNGYTDLPPRDSQNNRLVSRFCAVSGAFPDGINSERRFSNRLHEADFPVELGIGGQSEWHRLLGDTNQERYVGLLNAIEVLENFSNENGVQFEPRNILDQLELHFNEE